MKTPDALQRQMALSLDKSFIVQAPAGSGKTTLLTQRILRLLSIVKKPEEILAITFTKKAAFEMRSRVIEALQSVAGEYAKQALEQNQKHNWNLLENPNRLQIKTIDSLCHNLAQQMPILSKCGSITKITDDAKTLYSQAAHSLLMQINSSASHANSIKQLLLHLNNDFNKTKELIAAMLGKRDQWLPHVHGQQISREDLELSLQNITDDCLENLNNTLPQEFAEEINILAKFAHANLDAQKTAIKHNQTGMDPGSTNWIRDDRPGVMDYWKFVAELFLTDKNTWRKTINKRNGFLPDKDNKHMKERMLDLLQQISKHTDFHDALIEAKIIPPTKYSDQQWETLEALSRLLPRAAAQLTLVFREAGVVDFIEVAQAANAALGTNDNPTDLALFLDYKIQHILVDEFQDTSNSQLKLLELLTAGWEPDDGRTLFVVGDPMQSIYRFRKAEVGLFIRARNQGIGNIKLNPITLTTNFRSNKKLIDWVNLAFVDVFPQYENITSGAIKYSKAQSIHKNQPETCIKMHVSDETNEIIKLIKSLKQQNPTQKIAILVRARHHLTEILHKLQSNNLAYQAIEIDKLNTNPIIQDLLALTKALLHPADRISWLAVLRAPWCGLSLKNLYIIAQEPEKTIWQNINDPDVIQKLDKNAQQNLLFLRDNLANALQNRGRKSLRNYVYDAWLSINGDACLTQDADIEDVKTYLQLLETFDAGGDIKNFAKLSEKIDALYTSPAAINDDTLQVMTIHKAKGLEFDVVILPGLHHTTRHAEKQLLLWEEQPRPESGDELILAPIKNYAHDKDKIYYYLAELEKKKSHFETMRLLYVAATRAKQQLHLFGTIEQNKEPKKGCFLSLIWPKVKEQFATTQKTQHPHTQSKPQHKLKRIVREKLALSCDLTTGLAQNNKPALQDDTKTHIGTAIHRILQQISIDGIDKWPNERIQNAMPHWQNMLTQLGISPTNLKLATRQIQIALENILSDSRGRWILTKHQDHHTELAISTTENNQLKRYKIDRTFIDENNHRWIIDYKTTGFAGENLEDFIKQEKMKHQQQMATYQKLLAQLHFGEIYCGLYYPTIPLWITKPL